MEAKFAKDMEEMEANEKWEKSMDLIPEEVRSDYVEILSTYSTFLKIEVFKFLALMDWNVHDCKSLYRILDVGRSIPHERIGWLFKKLAQYEEAGYMRPIFVFFGKLEGKVLLELFGISEDELAEMIELARFLPPLERDLMTRFVYELSITEVLEIKKECDEPTIKACRLCRLRRVHNLELRMRHDQIPPKMIRVTGALPIYEKAEVWTADDENDFTFDSTRGVIYWQNNVVDLVKICNQCLLDCHGAATNSGRFDEFHHIEGADKKQAIKDLKDREVHLGELVGNIARERVKRRVKEWAQRSLSNQRMGQRLEKEAREKEQRDAENERMRAKKEQDFQNMLQEAGSVDTKWRTENRVRESKDLKIREHIASLDYMVAYDRDNPAPITREDPLSWQHAHYLPDGTPVSTQGAVERFGTHIIKPETQQRKLQTWRKHAIEMHEEHLRRKADFKERERAAELEEFGMRVQYVQKRIQRLERNKEVLGRTLELEEQARVDKRKADRAARAAIRFAKQEALERCAMEVEDDLSGKRRFFEWEYEQVAREREGMWYEEREQRSVDNFWGLEVEALRLQSIREKFIDFYDKRTAKMRTELIYTKQLRPFVIEAARKEYRNPFTGEVLK